MATPPAAHPHFEDGDVLLKYCDGGLVNQGIAKGQSVSGGSANSDIVHAAIFLDGKIVESQGDGVVASSLGDNLSHYTYERYRYTGANKDVIVKRLSERAQKALASKTPYTVWGAVCSLFKSDKPSGAAYSQSMPLLGVGKECFCSGGVVDLYNYAAADAGVAPPFAFTGAAASPQAVANFFTEFHRTKGYVDKSSQWTHVDRVGKPRE